MYKYRDRYKIGILLLLSVFLVTACSIREIQIRRAKEHYKKGQVLLSRKDVDRAILNFNKSIKMARAADFEEGVAHNLNELAIIHTAKGEFEEARNLLKEALEIYQKLNMEAETSKAMDNIALTYVKENKFTDAIKWFYDLMEWDKKIGNELGIGITLYNLALIYHQHLDMKEEAKACFIKALKIFKDSGNEKYIQMIQKRLKKKSK